MEIVYKTKEGIYPFNRTKDTQFTYVQHITNAQTASSNEELREIARKYKSISCAYLVHLNRTLKSQLETHFFFDYYPVSVENFLKNQPFGALKRIKQQLGCALKCLQKASLKGFARIQNIAIDSQGSLKMFLTPESLQYANGLTEFYATQKTRLQLQLEQTWEKYHSREAEIGKQQNNPGFRISGNQLIFGLNKKQNQIKNNSNQEIAPKKKKQEILSVHSTEMLLGQIQKQKQRTKQLKNKQNSLKSQNLEKSESKRQAQQTQFQSNQGKKSSNSESETMRESHKSQAQIDNKKANDGRLINSAAEASNNNYYRLYDRPISQIKSQKQADNHRNQLTYEELKEIAMNHLQNQEKQGNQEPKIQITTEMVSKYKMKIVTCQQIQFEGKEGDDIQKIAQEKLLEYQQQYNLPNLNLQTEVHHSNQETNTHTTNDKSGSFDQCKQKKEKKKIEGTQSEEIMTKIWKAKAKAQNVLKQYKTKKK